MVTKTFNRSINKKNNLDENYGNGQHLDVFWTADDIESRAIVTFIRIRVISIESMIHLVDSSRYRASCGNLPTFVRE